MSLNRSVKRKVIDFIIKDSSFLGKYEKNDGIISFLNKFLDLRSLPSEDSRFKDAHGDAYQHLVNNNDWNYEFLFYNRFNIAEGDDEVFKKFIETVVHPTVRWSKEDILYYVKEINSILGNSSVKLIITDYFEELPVHTLVNKNKHTDLPAELMRNQIPVFVDWKPSEDITTYIFLTSDSWNDYGIRTLFQLDLIKDGKRHQIGWVRIMKKDEINTNAVLPREFMSLSSEYCSLSGDKNYYISLKNRLGNNFYSFLYSLRDAALFPKIYEEFENDEIFKTSLLRTNDSDRIRRTVRFEIEGINYEEYYKFNYSYKPPFSTETISAKFNFDYTTAFERRIYALIGKNGTGKTRLLASLAKSLSIKDSASFSPHIPIFGKVFTLSYSYFDKFDVPESNASFNYIYCGLKKAENSFKTAEELFVTFVESANQLRKRELDEEWKEILSDVLDEEIIKHLKFKTTYSPQEQSEFDIEKFKKIQHKLSSGQSILLYIFTEVLANIRLDSLILFDEPENHLHPNALSASINSLFKLLSKFESFAIIATHSPIVVQEIPAQNVYIIERINETAYLRQPEKESFGENLTTITEDIFGKREIPAHYLDRIKNIISEGKTYEEILKLIQTEELTVSSNVRLYIKSLINK
ncbi:MAG: AAA family ATPase [Candidatus Cyclobacteriaceae bacterium M2_1C_046]